MLLTISMRASFSIRATVRQQLRTTEFAITRTEIAATAGSAFMEPGSRSRETKLIRRRPALMSVRAVAARLATTLSRTCSPGYLSALLAIRRSQYLITKRSITVARAFGQRAPVLSFREITSTTIVAL